MVDRTAVDDPVSPATLRPSACAISILSKEPRCLTPIDRQPFAPPMRPLHSLGGAPQDTTTERPGFSTSHQFEGVCAP